MAQLMNPDADYMTIVAAEEHFTARDIQLKKSHEDTLNTLRGKHSAQLISPSF